MPVHDEIQRVAGVDLIVRTGGEGPLVLFLHGEDGHLFTGPVLDHLAERTRVVAPLAPGWGSPRPRALRTLDDVAYLYLDLIEGFDEPCTLVGCSIGGWLAAEIATKSTAGIAAVVLASPLGIKTTARDERGFVDIWAAAPAALVAALYSDPSCAPDQSGFGDDELLSLALAQEAVARYGWEPYLHNPSLRHRLRRIGVPTTVVAGGRDHFVLDPGYHQAYADAIGAHARLVVLPEAGHRVEEEAPDALATIVGDVAGAPPAGRAAAPSAVGAGRA